MNKTYTFIECPITDDRGRQIDVVKRPIVPLVLSLDDKNSPFLGLIDTGSDLCIFPTWMAKALGHHLLLGEERIIKGFSGSARAYKHTTYISILETGFRCDSYYSSFADKLGFGILGLACLKNFSIEFKYPNFFKITEL